MTSEPPPRPEATPDSVPLAGALPLAIALTLALRLGLGAMMAAAWAVVQPYTPAGHWTDPSIYGTLEMPTTLAGQLALGVWARWDAIHYLNLAELGYAAAPVGDTIFYPLFPLLTRGVGFFLGGNPLAAALVVATLATAASLACLKRLGDRLFGSGSGRWACLALATTPVAVFLLAPYSESVFLALTLAAFLAAYGRNWWAAALLAGLASLTRGPGMAAALPLALIGWADASASFPRPPLRRILGPLAAAAVPILSGLAYLLWRSRLGLPSLRTLLLEYVGTTATDPITGLIVAVRQWTHVFDLPTTLDVLSAAAFITVTVLMFAVRRWRKPELIAYMLISLAFLLARRTDSAASLKSLSRYVLVLFPGFLVVGDWLSRAPRAVQFASLVISSSGLLVLSALYALWFFIG